MDDYLGTVACLQDWILEVHQPGAQQPQRKRKVGKQPAPKYPWTDGNSELEKMCKAYEADRTKMLEVEYTYKDGKRYRASLPLEDLHGAVHVREVFARFTSFSKECVKRVSKRFPDMPLLQAQAVGTILVQTGFVSFLNIVFVGRTTQANS